MVVGNAVVPDPRGTLPGRGAHLHLDHKCLDLAIRRRAFPRAFRLTGALDAARVVAHVEESVVDTESAPPRERAG
ncbi:hypothetical protein FHU37_005471 [Allostreptomyces psammosilenae]|uniref:YlxR domain-containing protein n=1 Tax=Allostreptomyces psammosilenae TaxID=1892865 RepID=A0A853ADN9_9ACTN|nr:hypothetical protein [Allostreptomyces psammosilenae]